MQIEDVAAITRAFEGVRRSQKHGLDEWRYRGRLVARQLDDRQLVIRSEFAARDALVHQYPETFCVPPQFLKHMMIVADVRDGNPEAIEDALAAAWELQRRGGR